MRSLAWLALPVLLAGCMAGGGTFTLLVTDQPNAIGDFTSLTVRVDSVVLFPQDNESLSLTPSNATFDLAQLTMGNTTTLVSEEVPAGDYVRLELRIDEARGVLAADGSEVDVRDPSGRLFLTTHFTVEEGSETEFLFDINVVRAGESGYTLTPNADGSGPGASAGERRGPPGA